MIQKDLYFHKTQGCLEFDPFSEVWHLSQIPDLDLDCHRILDSGLGSNLYEWPKANTSIILWPYFFFSINLIRSLIWFWGRRQSGLQEQLSLIRAMYLLLKFNLSLHEEAEAARHRAWAGRCMQAVQGQPGMCRAA